MTAVIQTGDDLFGTAVWIVDPVSGSGTHTTIASALTSASSGQTIFIRPGTYTENLTLKAGVNLTAFGSDSSLNGTGDVIISGTCTFTGAGSVSISGIQLQTNSAALLAVTGSAASVVNLTNCFLNCSNNTGITFSSSNAAAAINIYNCAGDLGTTGIGLFTASSAGTMLMRTTRISNTGASTTASTTSSTVVTFSQCTFLIPFTTSSSGVINATLSVIDCSTINTATLVTAGTGTSGIIDCYLASGTASTLSAGTGTTIGVDNCTIVSSNTNAITGAGSVSLIGSLFAGSSHQTNPTTQTGGAASGLTQGTAPSAGFVGEQIRATVASGAPVTVNNSTITNITNISLTPGIWDVTGILGFSNTAITGTNFAMSVNTVSATLGTTGDNVTSSGTAPSVAANLFLTVPAWRVTISATTICYLIAYAVYTVGSLTAFGRISATRVG
jgi:hypothetical protein